jgi:hypothetical protein
MAGGEAELYEIIALHVVSGEINAKDLKGR